MRARTQAALSPDAKASGTSVLSVSVGNEGSEKFVLCHLTPGSPQLQEHVVDQQLLAVCLRFCSQITQG